MMIKKLRQQLERHSFEPRLEAQAELLQVAGPRWDAPEPLVRAALHLSRQPGGGGSSGAGSNGGGGGGGGGSDDLPLHSDGASGSGLSPGGSSLEPTNSEAYNKQALYLELVTNAVLVSLKGGHTEEAPPLEPAVLLRKAMEYQLVGDQRHPDQSAEAKAQRGHETEERAALLAVVDMLTYDVWPHNLETVHPVVDLAMLGYHCGISWLVAFSDAPGPVYSVGPSRGPLFRLLITRDPQGSHSYRLVGSSSIGEPGAGGMAAAVGMAAPTAQKRSYKRQQPDPSPPAFNGRSRRSSRAAGFPAGLGGV